MGLSALPDTDRSERATRICIRDAARECSFSVESEENISNIDRKQAET